MRIHENRQLREERGRIAREMTALADAGLSTSEAKERFNRLDAEQKRLAETIDKIERADEVYREMRSSGAPPNGQVGIVSPTEREDGEYKRAFGRYLRHGRSELTMEDRATLRSDKTTGEFRDMGSSGQGAYPGIISGGGIFVPVGFVHDVERAMKYYGPMLNGGDTLPRILDTDSGQPLPMPTSNDTAVVGELIGKNQQVTTADVTIGAVMMGAWKFSSKLVKVSIELMEDSAFDMEQFLIQQFAERIGRAANSYLTTGSGTSQPNGLLTAVLASGPKATAVGAGTNDGVSGANTIGSDDLVTLEHLVDPLYRGQSASYMLSDSVLKSLKQVKDKYGRPLWQPGVRVGEPDTINGYRYSINPYFDALQTNTSSPPVTRNTMTFGRHDKYVVRRVRALSVLRLSERFADFGQLAFIAFARMDGNLIDAGTHPVGLLQNIY